PRRRPVRSTTGNGRPLAATPASGWAEGRAQEPWHSGARQRTHAEIRRAVVNSFRALRYIGNYAALKRVVRNIRFSVSENPHELLRRNHGPRPLHRRLAPIDPQGRRGGRERAAWRGQSAGAGPHHQARLLQPAALRRAL